MRVISFSSLSLAGGSAVAEARIPLWWADGTTVHTNNTASGSTGDALADGGQVNTLSVSSSKLFTLSSNWPSSLKFALEVTMYQANASYIASAQLYDFTASANVGSSVTTQSTTATVVRSGQFTLTPNRQYGVNLWTNNASYYNYMIDASLIIFPS